MRGLRQRRPIPRSGGSWPRNPPPSNGRASSSPSIGRIPALHRRGADSDWAVVRHVVEAHGGSVHAEAGGGWREPVCDPFSPRFEPIRRNLSKETRP